MTEQMLDNDVKIPALVDPALAVRLDLFDHGTVYANPYETLIPKIHDGPPVSYATNIFPGGRPGWLLRQYSDTRAILQDDDTSHVGNILHVKALSLVWGQSD